MPAEADLTAVTLECNLKQEPSVLRIAYTIKNGSSRDIILFNRIPTREVDDTHRYSASNVYVDLRAPALAVSLMILPLDLPPGVKLSDRPIPDVSLLRAGQTLAEEVILREPIEVRNPIRLRGIGATLSYDAKRPNQHVVAMKPASATELTFTVGVAALAQGATLSPVSEAFPDVFMPRLSGGEQKTLVKNFHLNRSVRILDYAVSD
jgi:hypothetical protein